jgi:putative transposase
MRYLPGSPGDEADDSSALPAALRVIGAGRYERTDTRVTERNGARRRLLATQAMNCRAADSEAAQRVVPKGSFFPVILQPRRRIDQALYAVVMEAYVNGVSTRSAEDMVAALGVDSGISKSEVSRICAGLDEQVAAFRTRPLHHTTSPKCSSTPPTCTCAAAAPAGRSPQWPSWWPRG